MPDRLDLSASRFLLVWLLLCSLVVPVRAADLAQAVAAVPNPRVLERAWVADPAGAIRARQADLNALIGAFERETGVEIAVVVLPSIGELNPKAFATALFKHWGIGKQDRDNGLLVLQVLDQRRVEIETGYGLEGALPDIKCHWIVEDIAIPFFRAGSFSDGHYEMARALIAGIRDPDATRARLTGGVSLTPGATVDPAPAAYRLAGGDGPAQASGLPGLLAPALLLAGLALFAAFARQARRHRLDHPDPREQWDHVGRQAGFVHAGMALVALAGAAWEFQGLGSLWSLLSLVPGGLLSTGYVHRRQRRLRDQPRVDPATGEVMRRLDEKADDAYLVAGQVSEERLLSVDYDVWLSASGHFRVDRYDGPVEAADCPSCGYRTSRLTSSRTVRLATRYAEGLAEDSHACAHCRHVHVIPRRLERLSDSASGGSFGGGSSGGAGGGSFGGGASGGGGAGGSY